MSFISICEDSHFSLHNLPYGIFSTKEDPRKRVGVAIGDFVLDLSATKHLFNGNELANNSHVFDKSFLNDFVSLGSSAWTEVRSRLKELLSQDNHEIQSNEKLKKIALLNQNNVIMHMPFAIGDYTDFSTSYYHAFNCNTIIAPDNDKPIKANWLQLPIAYHGRSSSVVISGTDIKRPYVQYQDKNSKEMKFGLCGSMDFELEMGFFIGQETDLGIPIPIDEAHKYIFGMVLQNDWSARDQQLLEMPPLGPFLSKNLGTTISPWVVTMEALMPFVTKNPPQNPIPLAYLFHEDNFSFDIHLEAHIKADSSEDCVRITETNFKTMYWTMKQMLAHHTLTGCNMKVGDLCGSGTVSGSSETSLACLFELTHDGESTMDLGNGITRSYLQNGDEIILTGYCQGEGFKVGFGECRGKIIKNDVSF